MTLFVKLLLAHLIGDFWLQPDSWVAEKELRRHRSPRLYLHALLHGLLSLIALGSVTWWYVALTIAVTHLLIDLAKVLFQRGSNRVLWFFLDQGLHIAVLMGVALFLTRGIAWPLIASWPQGIIIATALVFLTSPSSTIIRILISHWTPDTLRHVSASLPDAGKFIGYLERFLVFLFVLLGRWEAVGFLLAAKSVFRFGDLREAQDRKLTEYVLIGTMLSF